MARHTTFRYRLEPTVEQRSVLSRHAGAARFAYNHCLAGVKTGMDKRSRDPAVKVPWSGFDQINAFNTFKRSERAGRMIAVDTAGTAEVVEIGLTWRTAVCQQVFEEAAVDLGHGLAAWATAQSGTGNKVGFPRFKKKSGKRSFRLRNKYASGTRPPIRVGADTTPRSVRLPGIGVVGVSEDTRPLRRMLAKNRAKIVSATLVEKVGRWSVSLTVEACDRHVGFKHPARGQNDAGGWVGVDRGLSALIVAATADGSEVARVVGRPARLAAGTRKQRQLARDVNRRVKGSHRRRKAVACLAQHHRRVRNTRVHALHQVSHDLVKTHDRIVLENLNIDGMRRNRHLARAISDAGWGEFARQVQYKQQWYGGQVLIADRWFASSKTCSGCGSRVAALSLAQRVFTCTDCKHSLDRDLNAAVNLAAWGERQLQAREPEARAPVINVRGREGSGRHSGVGETSPEEAEIDTDPASAA
ncbi:RNA-guided endonuclease InsQ/TnpB family protein [Nocardia sp. NPDC058114]|uniref:RNA-guided endonuclease InsQ/TnpB family protein n=1 Tax=Nocardia sp. NPDC058114 TaxID=3346346 RepID=UPI0036D8F3C4